MSDNMYIKGVSRGAATVAAAARSGDDLRRRGGCDAHSFA